MRKQKDFSVSVFNHIESKSCSKRNLDPIVHLEKNPADVRAIDWTKWLHQGIDEWVWAFWEQLEILKDGKSVTPSTLVSYGLNGAPYFFRFLIQSTLPCKICDFNLPKMEAFILWLGEDLGSQLKIASRKSRYDRVKPLLIGLQTRGLIPQRQLFPLNPFPGSNASRTSESPLSQGERERLADALRSDIVEIYKGRFKGTEGEALTVHALILALRTGLNPTPLLELERSSLKPHPFMPNMMMLESVKRRGNATHLKGLRFSKEIDDMKSISMDGVAIFKKVLERTQSLVKFASEDLRVCLWLYRKERSLKKNEVTKLTYGMLLDNTQEIINRHDLRSDDGERLRLNTSRLRKTMENRLWVLSNGDIFSVANVMGHSPRVADTNYLSCTPEILKNSAFVGEALPGIYRGSSSEKEHLKRTKFLEEELEKTPVGSCKNGLEGDKSPKNGTYCSDFLSCFECRSYAIVGAPEDLHRLFSFYWFLSEECNHLRDTKWAVKFAATMNLIDQFTSEKFDSKLVADAKDAARIDPLKFWKKYQVESMQAKNNEN